MAKRIKKDLLQEKKNNILNNFYENYLNNNKLNINNILISIKFILLFINNKYKKLF